MRRLIFPAALVAGLISSFSSAKGATLDRSTFTEVVNRVTVLDATTHQSRSAHERDLFVAPEVLRTGPDSRAELVAPDQTVTRVGANTIFSFARNSREMELQKGSLLFQSPAGQGGGQIRTQAASAAVLGTTLIVSATKEGAMKVLLLEGHGKVTLPGGATRTLHAGQLVLVQAGHIGPVLEFSLREEATKARLVKSFKARLPSQDKILRAERAQQRDIDQGRLVPRGRPLPPPRDGRPLPPGTQPPPPPRPGDQLGGGVPPPPPMMPPPPPPPGMRSTAMQVQQEQQQPPPSGPRRQPPPPRNSSTQ